MSQSRFSIVLVGVSALLRRPLVSRLRPADGERSPWVVFAARVGRFESGFRSVDWPSGSPLPLFGTHRFGVAARRVGLRAHRFRFSARTASEWLLGEFVLPPSVSELPLGGLAFGLIASAFRPAPIRSGRWAGSFFRLPFRSCRWASWLRAHCFRFSARTDSGLPSASWFFRLPLRKLPSASWFFRSAGWPSGSLLPLFGMHRFGVAAGRIGLRASASELPLGGLVFPLSGLAFGLTASAFRHAPLRSCRSASWFFRSVSWPSGFRFGNCPRRVGLRAHCFRFSACAASEIALGGLLLPPSASEIAAGWVGSSVRRVGLRAHCFRFSACTASEWPLGGLVLPPSASEIAARRVGLRAHCFRFSACTASEWPLGEFVLPPSASGFCLPLRRLPLGGLAFGLIASAFRHAPLRSCRWAVGLRAYCFGDCHLAGWRFRLPLRGCPRRVGLRAHCFRFSACADPHRSAPPRRRREGRRSTPTRHLVHFKTLIPTC